MGNIQKVVKPYKFSIGQHVVVSATRFDRVPVTGTFKIMALLPAEAGEQQYRIKNDREAFERRVGESRLTLANRDFR